MEQKKNEQKTAQVLYMTIILVLLIMAVAVGLVTAANKRNKPAETSANSAEVSTSSQTTAHLPIVTTAPKPQTTQTLPAVTEPAETSAATRPAASAAATDPITEAAAPESTLPVFIMPTIGNVSKSYSVDVLVYSDTMEDYRTHSGIDICAGTGEGVMAAADGVVSEVYAHPMMGYTVVVRHDGSAETVYQNLAEDIAVSVGDTVKSGEVIGAIGDSALIEIAEEPHLHFELRVDGKAVNPLDYISAATMTIVYDE